MKVAAFQFVVFVVAVQLFLIAGTLTGCLLTQNQKCDGSKMSEMITAVTAQAFALYAAEK